MANCCLDLTFPCSTVWGEWRRNKCKHNNNNNRLQCKTKKNPIKQKTKPKELLEDPLLTYRLSTALSIQFIAEIIEIYSYITETCDHFAYA